MHLKIKELRNIFRRQLPPRSRGCKKNRHFLRRFNPSSLQVGNCCLRNLLPRRLRRCEICVRSWIGMSVVPKSSFQLSGRARSVKLDVKKPDSEPSVHRALPARHDGIQPDLAKRRENGPVLSARRHRPPENYPKVFMSSLCNGTF